MSNSSNESQVIEMTYPKKAKIEENTSRPTYMKIMKNNNIIVKVPKYGFCSDFGYYTIIEYA